MFAAEAALHDLPLRRYLRAALAVWLAAIAPAIGAQAQSSIGVLTSPATPTIFWSQVDTYVGLTHAIDFMMLASGTPGRNGDHPEFVLGPNIDIGLLNFIPHLKLSNPEKSKYLTFRIGYRYVKNLCGKETAQNNGVLELTPRIPLPWGFQIADRNRIDLRGLPQQFSWNYRNRFGIARSIQVRQFAFTPYGEAEIFYNCKLGEWTQYNYRFGIISRITPRVEVDTWFKRTTTIVEPIASVDAAGVKLILFFRNFNR